MWPKLNGNVKKEKETPIYTLPSHSDGEGRKRTEEARELDNVNNRWIEKHQRNSCRILTATFSVLALVIVTSVGIYASVHMMDENHHIQLITRPRPISVRSVLMRHNGTLEDGGERFLIFNFPMDLVVVKRIPDTVTLRRVSVNTYRDTTLVGQRSDYLGVTVDVRVETIQTLGTVFLKGNAASACESAVPSFILVDTYAALEFGSSGEKTTFEAARQKYLVCCSKQSVCSHSSTMTRYVM